VWLTGPRGLISHGSLVERTLVCSGQTLRVGYVEAVTTMAAHRRTGHGATVMKHIVELIRERYALGALSTGTRAFYETLGWERWRGPTFADGPRGRERTPGDDAQRRQKNLSSAFGIFLLLRRLRRVTISPPNLHNSGDSAAQTR
jgi:hypothetical protein